MRTERNGAQSESQRPCNSVNGSPGAKQDRNQIQQALIVKEDSILEDNTGTMELHIWEPLFTQLKSNTAYYFQNLTLRYYQGSKFLSTNRNTTYSEETTTLQKLVGPEILTNPEREIIVSQLKYVASLSMQKTNWG